MPDINFISLVNKIVSFLISKDFWIGASSAFFGALCAFGLNYLHEIRREKDINISNLHNLMIVLTNHIQKLCPLKYQFIDTKRKVLIKVKRSVELSAFDKKDLGIKIAYPFEKDFDTKNILFLIKNEPNLYLSLILYFDTLQNLGILLEEYNQFITSDNDAETFLKGNDFRMRALKKQVKSCISECNNSIKNLELYGKDYFGKGKMIGITFPDEIKKIIAAIFPRKNLHIVKPRTFMQKYFPTYRRIFLKINKKSQAEEKTNA